LPGNFGGANAANNSTWSAKQSTQMAARRSQSDGFNTDDEIERLVEKSSKEWGSVDILINNSRLGQTRGGDPRKCRGLGSNVAPQFARAR